MKKPIRYITGILAYLIVLLCIAILWHVRYNYIQVSLFHAILLIIGMAGGVPYAYWALFYEKKKRRYWDE